MIETMARTPQPGFLSAWVSSFSAFDQAHGFAVNLFAVVALAVIGAAFVSGRPRLIRPAVIAFTILCLADWVLVQDLGFLGGLGTDPNSMIPLILLFSAGYLALVPGTPDAEAPAGAAEAKLSLSRLHIWSPRNRAIAHPLDWRAGRAWAHGR